MVPRQGAVLAELVKGALDGVALAVGDGIEGGRPSLRARRRLVAALVRWPSRRRWPGIAVPE